MRQHSVLTRFLFSFAICALGQSTASPDSFVGAIEKIKQSVIPIVCLSGTAANNAKLDWIAGSAFFVSDSGSFLTARHVIQNILEKAETCQIPAIYLPVDQWHQGTSTPVRWFRFHPQACSVSNQSMDLAVCSAPGGLPKNRILPLRINGTLQPDGSEIAFTGFPLNIPIPMSARGAITGYRSNDGVHVFNLLFDRSSWPGASGSPIFRDDGQVIGIVIGTGFGGADGLSFGKSGVAIQAFLSAPDKYK